MSWAMQRVVINQGASDIASQLADALAARGLKVVLAYVRLEDEGKQESLQSVTLQGEHLGIIEIAEDHMVLTMQLALAAHVDRLILVCPEYALGSSPAAAHVCSLTLSRAGVSTDALTHEALSYLNAAHQAQRRLIWVQVVQGTRPWLEGESMPNVGVQDG